MKHKRVIVIWAVAIGIIILVRLLAQMSVPPETSVLVGGERVPSNSIPDVHRWGRSR
jgi:hypothetical protein